MFVLVLVLVLLVAGIISSPWRRPPGQRAQREDADQVRTAETELADLLAARDAKYGEIRDAELDRDTRKLASEDFAQIDGGLRAEAVEILRDLDRARERWEQLQARAVDSEGPL